MKTLRDFGLPLVLALLLHAAVVGALGRGWGAEADQTRVAAPRILQAELLTMETPKRRPREPIVDRLPPPEPTPKPLPKPPPKPKPVPTPEPPAVDLDAERREREAAEREERLRELAEQSTLLALEDEAVEQGDASADTMSYVAAITRAIVLEWSRPPSARNDMEARLQVDLTPAGDLLGVQVVDSSGNEAFDRSAEAAVRKAARTLGRFPVPGDLSVFEAQFRRLTLLFKPEDLLR